MSARDWATIQPSPAFIHDNSHPRACKTECPADPESGEEGSSYLIHAPQEGNTGICLRLDGTGLSAATGEEETTGSIE